MLRLTKSETCSLAGTGAVFRLEEKFSRLAGHRHALAVCNATQGLLACFLAMDVRGSDVITTPYTWGGSLSGMVLLNNRPVFADIDPQSLTLDPESVRKRMTGKTRAVLAVDIYGNPCAGQKLRDLCDAYGLWLIQDCTQSLGALYQDRQSGWKADAAVFSFSYGKPLYAGEGGVITTPHDEVYERLVWWTQHPTRQKRDLPGLPVNEWAVNMRMHPDSARLADRKFANTLKLIRNHQARIAAIEGLLSGVPERSTCEDGNSLPSYYRYTVEISSERKREQLNDVVKANGLKASLELPPVRRLLYQDPVYREYLGFNQSPCPHAEEQVQRRVWIRFPRRNRLWM